MKRLVASTIPPFVLLLAGYATIGLGGAILGLLIGLTAASSQATRRALQRLLATSVMVSAIFLLLVIVASRSPLVAAFTLHFSILLGVVAGYVVNLRRLLEHPRPWKYFHAVILSLAIVCLVPAGMQIAPALMALPKQWTRAEITDPMRMTPALSAAEQQLRKTTRYDLRVGVELNYGSDEGLVKELRDTGLFLEVDRLDRLSDPPDLIARPHGGYFGDTRGLSFYLRRADAPELVAFVHVWYRLNSDGSLRRYEDRIAVEVIHRVNDLFSVSRAAKTLASAPNLPTPLRVWYVEKLTARYREAGATEETLLAGRKEPLDGPLTALFEKWEALLVSPDEFAGRLSKAQQDGHAPDLIIGARFSQVGPALAQAGLEEQMLRVSEPPYLSAYVWFINSDSPQQQYLRDFVLGDQFCRSRGVAVPFPLSQELDTLSKHVAQAYLAGDTVALEAHADDQQLHLPTGGDRVETAEIRSLNICGIWGNSSFAFVEVDATYVAARSLGRAIMLLIMRKKRDGWKLLTVTRDPVSLESVTGKLPVYVASAADLAQRLLITSSDTGAVHPPQLLTPTNGEAPPQSRNGCRLTTFLTCSGTFAWRPSPSSKIVAEIVEFAYPRPETQGVLERYQPPVGHSGRRVIIRIRHQLEDALPIDEVHSGGLPLAGNRTYRWRVWSISADGSVTFSEPRDFRPLTQ